MKGSGLSGVSLSPRRSHSFISHGGGRDFLFANPSHPTSSKYMDLHIEVVTIYFLPLSLMSIFKKCQGKESRSISDDKKSSKRYKRWSNTLIPLGSVHFLRFTHLTFYRGMDQKLPRRRRDPEQLNGDGEKKGSQQSSSSQQMKPAVERKSPDLPGSKKNNQRMNKKIKRYTKVINKSKAIN